MNNESWKQHSSMYKLRTPPWKDAFRARCFQRLKSSRSQLVDKFRGLCTDEALEVMMAEGEGKNNSRLPHLVSPSDVSDSEINEFLSIMEEIKGELLEEERKLLEEYSKDAAFEVEEDQVVCPICKKDTLHQNYTVIFCSCGMRIDVQQDGLTLRHLKNELSSGLQAHEQSCSHPPSFSMITLSDITNLTITCGACDFMYIVI